VVGALHGEFLAIARPSSVAAFLEQASIPQPEAVVALIAGSVSQPGRRRAAPVPSGSAARKGESVACSVPVLDLIGREQELAALRASLDSALAGHVQSVILAGEPGIGKTRLVQAFSEEAAASGVAALWGRCHEPPGAPPYWPWLQILRGYAQGQDEQGLRAVLASGASDIAQIWPELRDRLPGLAAPSALADPAQARFRLFDSVSEFWRKATARQPLLLIFEDLHWADIPSLRLLEFVSCEAAGSRALLIGTFRDTDVPSGHPLAATLAEVSRKSAVRRIRVTGLCIEETGRLVHAATRSKPSSTTTAFVQDRTGGNPLFVAEMARYLAQEGLLADGSNLPFHAQCHIPEGIRAFIGIRLNRLSAATRRLLQEAAVIGQRFGIGVLRRVSEAASEEQVLAALDEALALRIVEERRDHGCYEFGHALIHGTLYQEIPTLERARLHQLVGAALERDHEHNLAPHLTLLAHHFHAALPIGEAAKAIAYAIRAAEQASTQLAHEEAVRWFTLALDPFDRVVPLDEGLRCQLLVQLGIAQAKSGHAVQALETLAEAAGRARHVGAANELAQAAIEFEAVAWRLGLPSTRALQLLDGSLERLGESDHLQRARAQSAMVRALVFAGKPDHARRLHQETLRLARRLGDPRTLEAALRNGFWLPWDPAVLEQLLADAHEAIALADRVGDRERVLDATAFRLHLLIATGDFEGFFTDLDRFSRLARELRQPFHEYHAACMRAAQALLAGRFADAEVLARDALEFGTRLPGLDASGAFGMQMFLRAHERGELLQFAPQIEEFVRTTPRENTWRPALALAELGRHREAAAELEQLGRQRFEAVARDSLWPICLAYLAQACTLIRDRAHAEDLYTLLAPWTGRNIVAGSLVVCYGPADRLLGMLSAVTQRWDRAERYFDAAIEMSGRLGAGPWLAHTQHQYAAMLLERGRRADRERASALLENAHRLAAALGMVALSGRMSQLRERFPSALRNSSYPGGLSPREAQVLRMIAQGRSNQQIAAAIHRSPNTVANHVRSILAKLGVANRTEAATFAARHGLL
jgi:DNA-binding CsgD family transcriptional regulator